jgi:hypothetical protein
MEDRELNSEWVLVPKEPTDEMLTAMHETIRILCCPAEKTADIQNDCEVYQSMLAAAPTAPATAGDRCVIVPSYVSADDANRLYGEAYGVAWAYEAPINRLLDRSKP